MLKIILLLLVTKFYFINSQNYSGCDYYQLLEPGRRYQINSVGFRMGLGAPMNTSCRYAAEADYGYKIRASCRYFNLFPLPRCENSLRISQRGRTDFADATLYCGWIGFISVRSLSNRMTIQFLTGNRQMGSKFSCSLDLIPDTCECGKRNAGRIFGGNETQINEFPLMAAITRRGIGVWCGATIISRRVTITAGHCFNEGNLTNTKVVTGEHNISSSIETRFTRSYDIANVIVHESYNSSLTSENDIALVFTATSIYFDYGVSPSCLPFRFANEMFSDEDVLGIGWGATEFAGPKSNALRKVRLTVINDFICGGPLLCTTAFERDLCQFDSGGPILYQYANNSLLYNIGVISSGVGCGTSEYSTNMRVTAYLDWILEKTKTTVYCAK